MDSLEKTKNQLLHIAFSFIAGTHVDKSEISRLENGV